jgi:hypothetical protein
MSRLLPLRHLAAVVLSALIFIGSSSRADPPPSDPPPAGPALLDRVVVRWSAPETGGPATPQFIFERELAFEARLEALADPEPDFGPYRDRHLRAALDRHIAETLLATLPVLPVPTPREVGQRAEAARAILEQRVHGRDRLIAAANAEGIVADELDAMLRRQARASLYLDRMVAPMLEPNRAELRDMHRAGATPFKDKPFEEAAAAISRWYVGLRLNQAVETYYLNARARVSITVMRKPK